MNMVSTFYTNPINRFFFFLFLSQKNALQPIVLLVNNSVLLLWGQMQM